MTWSHFLTRLQMSMPETLLFSCEFSAIFQKSLFTEHIRMTAPTDSSVPTKVLSIDHTFSFIFLLLLLIIAIMVFTQKKYKNENFFTFCNSFLLFTYILLRQFHHSNNLPTHIKENANFLWQKPW